MNKYSKSKKVFMRSILPDGSLECSWYNVKGKRYKHVKDYCVTLNGLSPRETDDLYGYLAYAKSNGFDVRDNHPLPHPPVIKFEEEEYE